MSLLLALSSQFLLEDLKPAQFEQNLTAVLFQLWRLQFHFDSTVGKLSLILFLKMKF